MLLARFLDAAFAVFVDGLRQFNIDMDTAILRTQQTFNLSAPDDQPDSVPPPSDNASALKELEGMLKGISR